MKNVKKSIALLVLFGIAGRVGAAEPSAKPVPPDAVAKEPAAITRTTVLPCPQAKPAFDHTKIDRTLKEPKYVSEKPAYRFFAFGPEGKSVMAMVLDESQGTGKGYDVLYIDLNLDRDITAAALRGRARAPAAGGALWRERHATGIAAIEQILAAQRGAPADFAAVAVALGAASRLAAV